jgi:chitosanase
MQVKDWQEKKIIATMCAFEQSRGFIKYDEVYIYEDEIYTTFLGAKKKRKQVTLSIGFTEGSGNLSKVLTMYCLMNGDFKEQLTPYLPKIRTGVLASSQAFVSLLKEMGQKDDLFGKCQEFAFRALILQLAYNKCEQYGIKTALGTLVIVDSVLHGSLDLVANMFPYARPSRGGIERNFIQDYVETRRNWWLNHDNNPWKGNEGQGTYRMDLMQRLIDDENWDLTKPFKTNGVEI